MEPLTVIKLLTVSSFTPKKEYSVINAKKSFKLMCEQKTDGGYYFSTVSKRELVNDHFNCGKLDGKLVTDGGTLRTNPMTMKNLEFVGVK